jgi:hypothetical protein
VDKLKLTAISLLTIFLTLLLGAYFPWWSFVPLCLAMGYFSGQVPIKAFTIGFFCVFAAWILQAYYVDMLNEGILTARIGKVFDGVSLWGLLLISGSLGGLGGGLAFATGSSVGELTAKRQQ